MVLVACAGSNTTEEKTSLTPAEFDQQSKATADAILIDVRTAEEHDEGAIIPAINIPIDELRERTGELPDGELIVYCAVGQRGHSAARALTQLGRRARNLDGGYRSWRAATRAGRLRSTAAG